MSSRNISWAQTQGAREYQQDSVLLRLEPPLTLVGLADGMGGHEGGERASKLALEAAADYFFTAADMDPAERLKLAVQEAHAAVRRASEADPRLASMGCTLVLAMQAGPALYWASVGDSPLWLVRRGAVERLNENHSMAAVLDAMAAKGELEAEEAKRDPRRSQLTSALGPQDALRRVDVSTQPLRLALGDTIVLASDGIESLDTATIAQICAREKVGEIASEVIAQVDALACPGQDNATVIVWRPRLSARGKLWWASVALLALGAVALGASLLLWFLP